MPNEGHIRFPLDRNEEFALVIFERGGAALVDYRRPGCADYIMTVDFGPDMADAIKKAAGKRWYRGGLLHRG